MSIASLKAAMREQDACALVFSEENGFYFTSFASTNGVLLVTADRAVYFTDSRYLEAARQTIASCDDILDLQSFETSVKPLLVSLDVKKIMIEGERLSVARWQALKKALPDAVFDSEALDGIINGIRARKRGDEVEKIVKAQRIAEEALRLLLPQVKVGAVERELALELDTTMRRLGARDVSFETILISGKETSKPHGVPSDKKIERGDFVTIDFGALYQGYHSDMTRTVAVGQASDYQREIYGIVLEAQLTALSKVKAGVKASEIDKAARDVITEKGYAEYFKHSTGHGVGLDIHELPYVSQKSEKYLSAGMVVTVEPGIYLPDRFGVRIEDMVLVTADGCKNFASLPKDLIVL